MRIVVTGATGFLGGHLLTRLRASEANHDLVAWARPSSDCSGLGADVEVRRGDWDDGLALREALEGADVVVHAAGGGKVLRIADVYASNAGSTRSLVEAACDVGVKRFVLVSSLAAAGGSKDGVPRVEDDLEKPASHYGKSKLEAERICAGASDQMIVRVLRPPAVYGPGDTRMVAVFRAAKRGVFPMVAAKGTMSMVYGPDCADAILKLCEDTTRPERYRAYFVSDGPPYARRHFAELVGKSVGQEVNIFPIPTPLLVAAGTVNEGIGRARGKSVILSRDKVADLRQAHQVCDATRLREELGWRPSFRFDKGAQITADWYREQGWL